MYVSTSQGAAAPRPAVGDLGAPVTLTTGPDGSGDEDVAGSHWRQAAVAIEPPRQVVAGEVVDIELKTGEGLSGGVRVVVL